MRSLPSDLPSIDRPQYEEFISSLRSALHYLYDPVQLRRSILVSLFGLSAANDRAAALQKILIDAIRALKPNEDEPPQSAAWRVYDLLNLEYIRQFSRTVVANQLGVSDRQLRRERRTALEVLGNELWHHYNLEKFPAALPLPTKNDVSIPISTELGWLKDRGPDELEPIYEILRTVQGLIEPLATKHHVSIRLQSDPELNDLPAPILAIRNIMLTILNAAIPRVETRSSGAEVEIRIKHVDPDVQIGINYSGEISTADLDEHSSGGMNAARQLAEFFGVSLTIDQHDKRISACLRFPLPRPIPVLVIDDNVDWLEMLKRYAVGSRYRIVTTQDPELALPLANKVQPAVIFVDVMMPNVDGWQVISKLRHDHAISHTPIIVSSVLPLEQLALSLGVNAFLQKPVTQEQFLRAIQTQVDIGR